MSGTISATAGAALNATSSIWPLRDWYNVNPFKIDALGLVTLLGAPEVNSHVGKLVRSRYLEFLPLLGAYIIASDEFTSKQPGYQLYNLDTKIYTPDIAGWFGRWLTTQDFRTSSSFVVWEVESVPYSFMSDIAIGASVGIFFNGGFLAVAVLMGDWWGFANAMSMAISTIARAILLDRNRRWVDQAIEAQLKTVLPPKSFQSLKKGSSKAVIDAADIKDLKRNKVIVVLPDARAVALLIPDCLVRSSFVFNPKPPNSKDETKRGKTFPPNQPNLTPEQERAGIPQLIFYQRVRMIAWAAFGAHVITIGMSCLVSQIITVFIIVVPTVLITYGFGCDQTRVGSRIRAIITELPHCKESEEKRVDMYAFLDLDDDQDESLHKWSLTPHKSNVAWWKDYTDKRKRAYHGNGTPQQQPLINMGSYTSRKQALVERLTAADPPALPPDPVPNARHVAHNQA